MITAKLNGGLGNQMFQVAVTVSLALDNMVYYAFNLDNKVVMQGKPAKTYKTSVFKNLPELPNEWVPKSIFKEQSPNHKPIPFEDDMEIRGYFQSEKNFINNKNWIVNMFSHKPTIDNLRDRYKDILGDSVSVHIRRGDYVKIGNARDIEYFYRALNTLWSATITKNILVFSDDISWCENNFGYSQDNNIHFISGMEDYEDMYLMSLCTNNITDMSSFSWWGAYLNRTPGKRVIMPGVLSEAHTSDFYFNGVIIIPQ